MGDHPSDPPPPRWIAALRKWFRARRRDWVRLLDARISIVPIALGILLLAQPQGRDVVRDLADGANLYLRGGEPFSTAALASYFRWFCFLAACVWSGLIAWYWPHLIARSRIGTKEPRWFTWVRRLLGLGPLAAATAAVALTGDDFQEVWLVLLLFAAAAALLLLFFIKRRALARRWFARSWMSKPSRLMAPLIARLGGRSFALTRGDDAFVLATFGLSLLVLLLFSVPGARTELAWALGSAAISFGAIGSMIAIVSALAWIVSGVRLPVITFGAAAILLFSCINDNHTIGAVAQDRPARPGVGQAYARWQAANPDGPIVLVATAGGASRAAYWTAAVLRALDDRTRGRFGRQVFAISAVSGGSLGAVGFAAWTADHPFGDVRCPYSWEARLRFDRAFFGGDYLSPALAGLLYPDLVQSFLPVAVFQDRATSLEEAWTYAWRDAAEDDSGACAAAGGGAADRFGVDFLAIWSRSLAPAPPASPRPLWVPIVLLNGTAVETGKRVITAPVAIDPAIFEDSYDFFDLFPHRVSAATAVTNSARFPLVSPAATVPLADGRVMRIVDGGYFENGGIETLYELARYLRSIDPARPILIIEINNDDQVAASESSRPDLARYPNGATAWAAVQGRLPVVQPSSGRALAPGTRSILGAFYQTRTSRGVLAAKRLSAVQAAGLGPNTFRASFHLGPLIRNRRTAMSWSLSLSSRLAIDGALDIYPRASEIGRELSLEQVAQGLDLRCQRAAITLIANAVDGGTRPEGDGCPHGEPVAAWTGVPLRPRAPGGAAGP